MILKFGTKLDSGFYPRYEVYRGYIAFAFSVIMFVNFFSVKDFSATT